MPNNTVRLIAYVMQLRPSLADPNVIFAERIDKKNHNGAKHVEFNPATIQAHMDSFALQVATDWGNPGTPVSVIVDREPTKRKPRGYDDRPRGHIINAPANTIVYG